MHKLLQWNAVLLMMLLSGCSSLLGDTEYWSPETTTRVVDAKTGKPVEGAIVVANWEALSGHSYPTGHVALFEVVTDKAGYFTLPAWGPKTLRGYGDHLAYRAPEIRIFKPGYYFKTLTNYTGVRRKFEEEKKHTSRIAVPSLHDGTTVALEPFAEGDAAYAEHLEELNTSLGDLEMGGCVWSTAPLIYIAAHKMRMYFQSQNLQTTLIDIGRLRRNDCGDPAVVFGELYREK